MHRQITADIDCTKNNPVDLVMSPVKRLYGISSSFLGWELLVIFSSFSFSSPSSTLFYNFRVVVLCMVPYHGVVWCHIIEEDQNPLIVSAALDWVAEGFFQFPMPLDLSCNEDIAFHAESPMIYHYYVTFHAESPIRDAVSSWGCETFPSRQSKAVRHHSQRNRTWLRSPMGPPIWVTLW